MNYNKILLIFLSFALVVFGGYYYANWHWEQLLKKPQRYPYVYYGKEKKLASVLIINSLKYKTAYVEYYRKVFNQEDDIIIDNGIPIRGLPTSYPVYIVGYTEDSLLAEVVSLAPTPIKLGNSYIEGWVYADALHNEPPTTLK